MFVFCAPRPREFLERLLARFLKPLMTREGTASSERGPRMKIRLGGGDKGRIDFRCSWEESSLAMQTLPGAEGSTRRKRGANVIPCGCCDRPLGGVHIQLKRGMMQSAKKSDYKDSSRLPRWPGETAAACKRNDAVVPCCLVQIVGIRGDDSPGCCPISVSPQTGSPFPSFPERDRAGRWNALPLGLRIPFAVRVAWRIGSGSFRSWS